MNGITFRDRARDPSLVVDMVRRRAPDADPSLTSALGTLWADALHDVVDAMTESTRASGRVVWPDEARAEMTFELAKLTLYIGERIVQDRLGNRDIAAINLSEEEAFLLSEAGKERAVNTGKLFAQHVWIRLYDRCVYQMSTGWLVAFVWFVGAAAQHVGAAVVRGWRGVLGIAD
jgi:hypothetical protein